MRSGRPPCAGSCRPCARPVRSRGSGSTAPLSQGSKRSASAGPCLKPWPEPPPSSHTRPSWSGCGAMTKCMSAVISYWHARWPDQRRVGQRREAMGEVRAREALVLGDGDALERLGIARRPVDVRGDLHPAPVEVAEAVGGAVVVDPAGDAGRAPGGGGAEVEDVLVGDAQVEHAREQRAPARRRTPTRRGRPPGAGRRRAAPRRRRGAPRRGRARRPPPPPARRAPSPRRGRAGCPPRARRA